MFSFCMVSSAVLGTNMPIGNGKLHLIMAGLWACVIAVLIICAYILKPDYFVYAAQKAKNFFHIFKVRKLSKNERTLQDHGFLYDQNQDIFYADIHAWQREYGYCRLYDEAAAPSGMIIDCEPIFFEFNEKKWMIEFWKGQYGMTTGGEIGIYIAQEKQIKIPGLFDGYFYRSADQNEMLHMSFSLYKGYKKIFSREGIHWWMTGFKLGEFSEPSQLSMEIFLTFLNEAMRDQFISGLMDAGYSGSEIIVRGNMVGVLFDKPHTPQPITRAELTDWVIQRKNEFLCEKFQEFTKKDKNALDKLSKIRRESIQMYDKIINFENFEPKVNIYRKIFKN